MRFDTPIFMQTVTAGAYDAQTGDYAPDSVEEVKVYASVTDAGTETLTLVYGDIKQGAKVVRLLSHCAGSFSFIRIGEKRYRVDMERKLRSKHIFVVSEAQ